MNINLRRAGIPRVDGCLIYFVMAVAVATIAGTRHAVGQIWQEIGDAGDLPGTAQRIQHIAPLDFIQGNIDVAAGDNQIDLYCIEITDPASFSASTWSDGGGASFDTRLWLFDANGRGVLANRRCGSEHAGCNDRPAVR